MKNNQTILLYILSFKMFFRVVIRSLDRFALSLCKNKKKEREIVCYTIPVAELVPGTSLNCT